MNAVHINLLTGWFPIVVQVVAGSALLAALAWRPRRWIALWGSGSLAVGTIGAIAIYSYFSTNDMSPDTAPSGFWIWIAVAIAAPVLLLAGVRSRRVTDHLAAVITIPLALLCVAVSANLWTGYYPTAYRAWQGLTDGPLPNQISATELPAQRGVPTPVGKIVALRVPHAFSGFHARTEFAYLPPAWFRGPIPPQLPVVVMLGGVINTPDDWVRSGNAAHTVDRYARTHGGRAPILVLADPSGSMNNDTECVNSARGNVETHILDEVRPAVIAQFGTATAARDWALAGWSMGGTCAVTMATRHPEAFGSFIDISGDIAPNLGDTKKTIAGLFHGDVGAWESFDPSIVMQRHGRYDDLAGWLQSEGHRGRRGHLHSSQITAARHLSEIARAQGVEVVERDLPGAHTWEFAGRAFADALPWLMSRLDVPHAV
ncbi:alpha/beta hydrolase-fold protein [Williamsia sp. CHRR-6]|uniref:alpha/beta hydrolase-fold protein n=1 Tax=Williamsia sp. CHRR-6 TaxID=2835871 RepID=UPI001BDADFDB|nr:alpha/beta hydrolase-fold protein [Williamsia sp. CHRR-6]MBT0565587.1 esterase family protein [Williamsia sp. CHRR-6]